MSKMSRLRAVFSLAKSIRKFSTKKSIDVTKILGGKQEVGLEEEQGTCVATEKEREASIKSRLSKEYSKLAGKKLFLTPSGLTINLYVAEPTSDDTPRAKPSPLIAKTTPTVPAPPSSRRPREGPSPVLYGFVPSEWFEFFEPKTGVTGFYTFLFTLTTYLVSKEWYVLEHNYYGGLSMAVLVWGSVKYVGPHLAVYLDREVEEYENGWRRGRREAVEVLEENIRGEELVQFQADGQVLLMEAKRENVRLQLEEEFRARQMRVYEEVKKRLDLQVQLQAVRERIQHKNLVEYVRRAVVAAITPDMQDRLVDYSIDSILAEIDKAGGKS